MANPNLISSKVLIGEMFADYAIEGTNWLGTVNRHIARGMEIMELHGYFKRTFKLGTLNNYRAALPCDNKNLIGIVIVVSNCVYRLPIESTLYSGIILNDLPIR